MQSSLGVRGWEVYSHRHLLKQLFIFSWQHTNSIDLGRAQPGSDSSISGSLHPSGSEGPRLWTELLLTLLAAVGLWESSTKSCRNAALTHHFTAMQPRPRLGHHGSAGGTTHNILPTLALLSQLLWKLEKKGVLDNIQMLKCKAGLCHPAGSLQKVLLVLCTKGRKCVSPEQLLRHSFLLPARLEPQHFPKNPKFMAGYPSPPSRFWSPLCPVPTGNSTTLRQGLLKVLYLQGSMNCCCCYLHFIYK